MKVVILTEGGKNIGFGHVARCLALLMAFRRKGIAPLMFVKGDASVNNILSKKDYRICDWISSENKLLDILGEVDIAVVDSYLAGPDTYRLVSKRAKVPVYIDDCNRVNYPKGIVLNWSALPGEDYYSKKKGVEYLLGATYAPLRPEFCGVTKRYIRRKIQKVLIIFGGEDTRKMSVKVADILSKKRPDILKRIILGRSGGRGQSSGRAKGKKTEVIFSPDILTLRDIMLDSDFAVSAAGQTLFELSRLGVPFVAVSVADNQENNVRALKKNGILENALSWEDRAGMELLLSDLDIFFSYDKRKKYHRKSTKIIDGKGGDRVVAELIKRARKR